MGVTEFVGEGHQHPGQHVRVRVETGAVDKTLGGVISAAEMTERKEPVMINKVLLYSTGNYILYPVINHKGKEHEKEYIV